MENGKLKNILEIAADILKAEGEALFELSALVKNGELGRHFEAAIELIYENISGESSGKVIITGMGKSGHIGRKIAATMASTGTPSYFVHPGEASHGDLGMISSRDVIIGLSNSGETAELSDVIHYAKRFSIPFIAITGKANSILGKNADIVLEIPKIREACPLGMAPMTSTTMMLALGDAISGALMKRRGFSAEDFSSFHPGGKLGKAFIKVKELMYTGVAIPLVKHNAPMSDVLPVMTEKSLGCAGVTDEEGNLIGIITDGDLRRHMTTGLVTKTAEHIMTKSPMTIDEDTLAAQALSDLNKNKRTQVFIVKNKKPIGILHLHDLLREGVM
ncbi:MAG: KpsF/GutQ family sugar-phosphate isomerase [Alphaproteobacteria bacterium]|nr:KpsF/GutQ family sugar-phosphate isomerase [Alphaproteobacteria bacterium]